LLKIPSFLQRIPAPSPLDAMLVIQEREKRIQARIKNRLSELKSITHNHIQHLHVFVNETPAEILYF
jgi:hypothetical protein